MTFIWGEADKANNQIFSNVVTRVHSKVFIGDIEITTLFPLTGFLHLLRRCNLVPAGTNPSLPADKPVLFPTVEGPLHVNELVPAADRKCDILASSDSRCDDVDEKNVLSMGIARFSKVAVFI